VISGGGNDARDAFALAAGGGDPTSLIAAYASDIGSIITDLETAGAHDILLVNVPDIGMTPAIRAYGASGMALASWVAGAMNTALNSMLGTLSPAMTDGIRVLDTFTLVDDIVADPAAFGMTDVTSACAFSQACIDNPDTTFFWDGIHPTTAGHAILARAALRTVPEPGTVLLIAIAALALLAFRPRRAPSRSAVPA
jgi:outer membrane lipase/esterase